MREKEISGWIVIDWKDESHRTRQSRPSKSELGANELLAELDVSVNVPDVEVPSLSVQIDVPEPKVRAATLEAIDDEDLPEWSQIVDTHLGNMDDAGEFDAPDVDRDAVASQVVGDVMIETGGTPNPDLVDEYVRDQLDYMIVAGDSA